MKYNVGDLVLVKECIYKPRLRLHPCSRFDLCPHLHLHLHLRLELFNSYGIITEAIKHSDAWEGQSTNRDNVYVWFSQVDGKQYFFCENEVIDEVIK